MLSLKSIIGFLCFDRESIKKVATHPGSLWIGLLFVIAAGFAREYDGEYLLAEPWHLVLPLAASLIGCSFMVLLIFIAAWCRGERKAGIALTFSTFLRCYWMTAPLAMVYGIPVERMFDPGGATQANLMLLAIVATWRVLLMIRCVHVLYDNRIFQSVVVVMLFSDVLALIALAYIPGPIIMIMGGVRLTASEQVILSTRIWVQVLGILSMPLWIIAYGVICGGGKLANPWRLFSTGVGDKSVGVERRLKWAAISCIAIWLPFLFWTQPEQQRRWQAEKLIGASDFEGLAQLSQNNDVERFPPHWDPPPRTGYGELDPQAHEVLSGLIENNAAPWLTDRFAAKAEEQISRRGWMIAPVMSAEDLERFLESAKQVDNGIALARMLIRYVDRGDEMTPERRSAIQAIEEFIQSKLDAPSSSEAVSDAQLANESDL